ncbi:phage antirepressor KilAC domain-containing protein [Acinetobacter johnsonii]|uniref:Rha family transcriptional regulator n=1 Tax=Acinetobacter johnsonii TaxID=40214 RepID=UPI0030F864D8
MNMLAQFGGNQKRMSHREVAELTGKEARHVKRDCEVMFVELGLDPEGYAQPWTHPQNSQTYIEYMLTRDLVETLITGYSIKLRHAVLQRWRELESQVSLPSYAIDDPIERAKKWIEEEKQKQAAIQQLELAAPKVKYFDQVADRKNLLNATQVGQKFGMSAIVLNRLLEKLNVYNLAIKRGRVFQQWFVDKGLGELKQTEAGHPQAMFTNLGEQWVYEKFVSEGVI